MRRGGGGGGGGKESGIFLSFKFAQNLILCVFFSIKFISEIYFGVAILFLEIFANFGVTSIITFGFLRKRKVVLRQPKLNLREI